jgi:hypothetical protein
MDRKNDQGTPQGADEHVMNRRCIAIPLNKGTVLRIVTTPVLWSFPTTLAIFASVAAACGAE